MRSLLFIFGSAIGAPLRFLIVRLFQSKSQFFTGVLVVNVVGSFLLPFFLINDQTNSAFLGMGFCGAFTTWSALALELDQELAQGENGKFLANFGLNLLLGFGAAALGAAL
ncbi:MAG: CrcB family protein [Acidobacteria bacterium]|nr:CrcB family protein [Acidobacteriota bacterium]